jgi:S-adenosyl methyltransferase
MASPDLDSSVPNVARVYDCLLGGKDNYEADRAAAAELQRALPDIAAACRENRKFLGRVVRFLAGDAGIGQFIDIGTGLPAMGNVHEIAQRVRPASRIVYVDYDRVVVRHAEALLAKNERVAVVECDLRTPRELLTHPDVRRMIDFSQPVAVLALAVLHFIPDTERPYEIAGLLRDAMAPGSYLALSHATQDAVTPGEEVNGTLVYKTASAPIVPRRHAAVLKFFDGMTLVAPGLVNVSEWPASRRRERQLLYGGVARKDASTEG